MTYSASNSSSQAKCLPYNTFTGYAKGPTLLLSGVPIKGPAINEFANRVLCPALDNQTITDPFNDSYLIGCDKTISGNADIAPTVLKRACYTAPSMMVARLSHSRGIPRLRPEQVCRNNCFPRRSTVPGLRKRQNELISSEAGSQFAIRVSKQGGGGFTTSGSVPGDVAPTQAPGQVPSCTGSASATGTSGSSPSPGNPTQIGGSFSPTGTGTSGPGASNSTQTGGLGGASGTGTTVPSVTGGFGNATGTSTGVAPPTPSNTLSCSGSNNTQYTDEFLTSYNITCGLDITGSNAVAAHTDTFKKCISFCDFLSGCAGVIYQTSPASADSNCHPYSSFNGYSPVPGPSGLLAAVPAKGGVVNNTLYYAQLCPYRAGQNITDRYGVTYTIGCEQVISGTDLPSTVVRSLNSCLLYCSLFSEGCAAVTFTGCPPGKVPSGAIETANPANCFPKSSTGPVEVVVLQESASYAKRVLPGLPVGSGNSTTGPGASSTLGVSGNSTSGASGISTSSIAGSPTSSASGNSIITVGASSTSGIAGNSTSAVIRGGSSTSGVPPLGSSTSNVQLIVSTTSGRLPVNPSSSRAPLGNSTSGVTPTGSAASVFSS